MEIEEHDLFCDDGQGGIDGGTDGFIAANIAEYVDGEARICGECIGFDNGGASGLVIDHLQLRRCGIGVGDGEVLGVAGGGVALGQVPACVKEATAHGGAAARNGSIETGGEEVLPLCDDGDTSGNDR